MDSDEVNKSHQLLTEDWCGRFLSYGAAGVEKLASKYRDNRPCEAPEKTNGSFNLSYKVVFEDNVAWAVRFPIPGRVMHPEEKVRREFAVLKFLIEHTRIPVPRPVAWGTAMDNHDPDIGPFVITEWVEGVSMTSVIEETPREEWGPVLRYDIDEQTLTNIYRQMARIQVELSLHDFDSIGALSMDTDGEQVSRFISSRPMALKANEIESAAYISVDDHTQKPFSRTSEYIRHLVKQNEEHLYKQRNSVDDAEDARRKFILRKRLEALSPHFVALDYESGPFKLFCDDFRPGNVLVDPDTLEIKAVIDWEWTYAAPYQFLYSPPQWLILEDPVSWSEFGEERYRKCLELFLQCLEGEEEIGEEEMRWRVPKDERLSVLMRRSIDDGSFWYIWLLREAFNFDDSVIGPNIDKVVAQRGLSDVGVPDEEQVGEFVEQKMKDLEAYNKELGSNLERDASREARDE